MQLTAEHACTEPLLSGLETALGSQAAGFFRPGAPITVARAPARLDCMGGIADYCGSVVFEMPLGRAVVVACQPREDSRLRVRSLASGPDGADRTVNCDLEDVATDGGAAPYAGVARRLSADPDAAWAAYVLGGLAVLQHEARAEMARGANMLVWSDVPIGVGVASSAALEVASMLAACGALGIELPPERLAALAQVVENKVVGAPCGIMDQVTSAMGRAGKLLALRCQPCQVMGQYNLPDNVRVFGLSSRVEHRVSGTAYTHARVAAFMGLRIINEVIEQNSDTENRLRYLCNLAPERYHRSYRPRLPESMNGAEFQQQYGSTSDAVTSVDPAACYRVRACTDHPVFENQRVQAFIACMERARACDRTALVEAGGLMYASHWSYGWNCHLGCRETDLLVDMVRRHGPDRGLYGAKITGGGSGGTVAVLAEADAEPLLHEVAAEYEQRTGLRPDIFDSTSPGACAFGTRTYHVKDNDD